MSELLLKALDYEIGKNYDSLGIYVGIYKNSYLIFIKHVNSFRVSRANFATRIITNIPTINEIRFIANVHNRIPFGFIKPYQYSFLIINKYNKLEPNPDLFPEFVFTVDNVYYNSLHKKDVILIITINRIYE